MSNTFVVLAIALVAVVLGAWLLRSGKKQQLSGDAQVVVQLGKAGSDLSKLHEIEFFMYFPAEAGAKHVAGKLNEIGFEAVLKRSASGSLPWHVLATRSMIPAVRELERLRVVLTELCKQENGEYDGWGTPIVK